MATNEYKTYMPNFRTDYEVLESAVIAAAGSREIEIKCVNMEGFSEGTDMVLVFVEGTFGGTSAGDVLIEALETVDPLAGTPKYETQASQSKTLTNTQTAASTILKVFESAGFKLKITNNSDENFTANIVTVAYRSWRERSFNIGNYPDAGREGKAIRNPNPK
jgi:hypothetical protein